MSSPMSSMKLNFTISMALIWFTAMAIGETIPTQNMSNKEREALRYLLNIIFVNLFTNFFLFCYGREEARDMFYHAYHAYMENAYPADELMPLSCKGRYRGVTPSRGDMDDILGK